MSRLGPLGELGERGDRVVDQAAVALGLGHLHQLDGVGELLLDRPGGADRLVEPAALAHHHLRRLGIVPQARVLDLGVQLVEPLQRPVPVEEPAQQIEGRPDLVDGGLRFGAHGELRSCAPAKAGIQPLQLDPGLRRDDG